MPAKSEAQRRLMAAAAHGATFAKAKDIRRSMSLSQIQDFEHMAPSKGSHPHKNLGHYLHPKKSR